MDDVHLCDSPGSCIEITTRQQRKATQLEAIYTGRAGKSLEIGYQARHFTLTSLPIRKHKELLWKRRNGGLVLALAAHPDYGLPYGQDRLALLWLVTQAVRRGSPYITFGAAREIFSVFGQLDPSGKVGGASYRRLMNRFQRIFGTVWYFGYVGRSGDGKVIEQISWRYIQRLRLWFSRNPDQEPLPGEDFQNLVELSPEFFREIQEHPIPVEMEAVRYLKEHPGCLDFYTWVVYRAYTLDRSGDWGETLTINLEELAAQLGSVSYHRSRRWREKIGQWLDKTRQVCPDFPAALAGESIVIRPASIIPPRPRPPLPAA